MTRSLALLAALAALSACGGGGGAAPSNAVPDNADAGDGTGRNYPLEVKNLSVGQRNGVFIRALKDANMECQGVSQSAPAPDVGPDAWRVTCVDGRKHLIRVRNNGTVDIASGLAPN